MKNKKVLNVRTHLGGLLGKTSYDLDLDGCDMEIVDGGVLIKTLKGEPMMRKGRRYDIYIPFPNTPEVLVEHSDGPKEEIRRGPGRPPRTE